MGSFLSLLPVVLVLACAMGTHHVHLSLLIGIVSAAYIATPTAPLQALSTVLYTIYHQFTTMDNVYVFLFLISIGTTIILMQQTGAMNTYVNRIRLLVSHARSAELMAFGTALLFFLDDYLSAFTTGALMGPLFDHLRIPRMKLAYIINATVPALCVLIPATSWTAMILSQMRVSGMTQDAADAFIQHDPFHAYLEMLGFILYPILSIITAIIIILTQLHYGTMASYKPTQMYTSSDRQPHSTKETQHVSFLSFFMPIVMFLCTSVLIFLYTGDAAILGGKYGILTAIGNAHIFTSLAAAAGISMVLSFGYMLSLKHITLSSIPSTLYHGYKLMEGSLGVLVLAWSFSTILQEHLYTISYLAEYVTQYIATWLLPVVIYGITATATASTGSAWGTITLMMPLTIRLLYEMASGEPPLALAELPKAHPTIAAVLSGAVTGGHLSPISDAAIVASTSSQSPHIPHVIHQIQYAIPPLIGSLCGYLMLGYHDMAYPAMLATGLISSSIMTIITLYLCNILLQKESTRTPARDQ